MKEVKQQEKVVVEKEGEGVKSSPLCNHDKVFRTIYIGGQGLIPVIECDTCKRWWRENETRGSC